MNRIVTGPTTLIRFLLFAGLAGVFLVTSPAAAQTAEYEGMSLVRAGDTYDSWFYLDRYEITNAEMAAYDSDYQPGNEYFEGDDRPATAVSFIVAQEFCESKGKRLPTTFELSLACGGPEGLAYSYSNSYDPLAARVGRRVWSDGPKPVGSYEPNGYGLYDMVGNVWEWTDDGSGQQPRAHGGSWLRGPRQTKCGVSQPADPMQRVLDYGFRCGKSLGDTDIARIEAAEKAKIKASERAAQQEEAARRKIREAEEAKRRQQIGSEAKGYIEVEEAEQRRIEEAAAKKKAAFDAKVSNMVSIGEGLSLFYVDKTEVTVAAFQALEPGYKPLELSADPQMPATGVTFTEAATYCQSLGKRLPSEEEWLAACLGKMGHLYGYGNSFDASKVRAGRAWFDGAQTVGGGARTSYGATEMVGNVWEWADGWYDTGKTRRVLLGGSWADGSDRARCTSKEWHFPEDRRVNVGFRCASDQMAP